MLSDRELRKRKREEEKQQSITFGKELHTRLISENGSLATSSQISQMSPTPPATQDGEEKPVQVRQKQPKRSHSPTAFFKLPFNPSKQESVRIFTRKNVNTDQIKKEFNQALENLIANIASANIATKKVFLGQFLFAIASDYTKNTMPFIIKEETDGAMTTATNTATKKIVLYFLANATGYGDTAAKVKLAEFRKQQLEVYLYKDTAKYPRAMRARVDLLKHILADKKKYSDLSDDSKATMRAMDDFIDNTLKTIIKDEKLMQDFLKLLTDHVKAVSKHFPNTAGHHIALLSFKIAAIIANPLGVKLPTDQRDATTFAKNIAIPFITVAANAGYNEAQTALNKYQPQNLTRPTV
jgi:hypothetical protein